MSAASTKGMRPRHLQQNQTSAKHTFPKLSHMLGLSGRSWKTFQRCKLWMGMRKGFLFGANKLRKCFEIRHFVCVASRACHFVPTRRAQFSLRVGNGPLRGNEKGERHKVSEKGKWRVMDVLMVEQFRWENLWSDSHGRRKKSRKFNF